MVKQVRASSPPSNRFRSYTSSRSWRFYILAAMILTLTFSLFGPGVIYGSNRPVAVELGQASADQKRTELATAPVTLAASSSFSYSLQWGSYGGPIMPNGVAVDSLGNVYVADAKEYAIVKLARNGSFIGSWGSYGSGAGQFINPEGIALDSSGNVYVSDAQNNNIQKFTNTGVFLTSWNTWNRTKTLSHPFGVSVNSTGFVYVVDQGDQRVQIYTNNGTYVSSFGGSGQVKFLSPFGVAVGPTFVYVSDDSLSTGNITEVTKTGGFVCTWGGSSLGEPAMLAVDNSSDVYVADNFYDDIVKLSPCNNKPLWQIGAPGAGPQQFNSPVGVAVDGQLNVLIGDSNNFRIEKITASAGSYVSSLTYPRFGFFSSPLGAVFDGSGHIYVADDGNSRIQEFSLTGTFLTSWRATESVNGLFDPFGIAVDHSGNVYVADFSNARVEKFLSNGTYLRDLGTGRFFNPYGVAVDGANNLYVTDYSNNTVQKFDSLGNLVTEWAAKTGNCQFLNPTGIVVDSSNNVYVSDSSNNRVEKCIPSGGFEETWGVSGSGNGQFNFPSHLALDSAGNLYVADTFNNRIQEFTNNGTFLGSFGTVGAGNGQLLDPHGLAVDNSGNVYAVDTGNGSGISNNRIEVFAPSSGSVGGRGVPVDMLSLLVSYVAPTLLASLALILLAVFVRHDRSGKRERALANRSTE